MTPERREAVRRWRDAWLVKMHGDEAAAARLGKLGPLGEVVEQALAIEHPTQDELDGCDNGGEPLDPMAGWWGHRGPSSIEKRARRLGLPWPPGEVNPYGKDN